VVDCDREPGSRVRTTPNGFNEWLVALAAEAYLPFSGKDRR
jgi:hypothetical protein